jgi:hypothetical protein
MKANGSELESRKSWSCQARRQGPCHGHKLLSNKQGRLGIARQPASGRDMELHDSNSVRDESHAKIPARIPQTFILCRIILTQKFDDESSLLLPAFVEEAFAMCFHGSGETFCQNVSIMPTSLPSRRWPTTMPCAFPKVITCPRTMALLSCWVSIASS